MARNKPAETANDPGAPQLPYKGYVACSASPFCKFPGRLWLPGMQPSERVCVDHFSTDQRRHELENWELGLVRKTP